MGHQWVYPPACMTSHHKHSSWCSWWQQCRQRHSHTHGALAVRLTSSNKVQAYDVQLALPLLMKDVKASGHPEVLYVHT
jgi:hypothetical protein